MNDFKYKPKIKYGIYLGAFEAWHPCHWIDYQDINEKRDISGDMLTINLEPYDYVIATPPCNWWSRGNYRRNVSEYSLKTKLLLPCIIYKLALLNKPFIVENVLNSKFFSKYELDKVPNVHMFKVGRHTYWTNICLDTTDLAKNERANTQKIQNKPQKNRQGTNDVFEVIERFIQTIESNNYKYY